jgi:hypothetical protein
MIYISSIISDKHYRLKKTLYRACHRCGPDDFKSVMWIYFFNRPNTNEEKVLIFFVEVLIKISLFYS